MEVDAEAVATRDDIMEVVGEFICESLHPDDITTDEIVKLIDSCADFKRVGR